MIRDRIEQLLPRLASERQFPTQGETLLVDLERQEVRRAYIPRAIVAELLGGRGVNMFLLYNLLDTSLEPLHPDIPLIFGTGILTSLVPSASRGNATSWSPETKVIMDSNAGDYFPSFMKLNPRSATSSCGELTPRSKTAPDRELMSNASMAFSRRSNRQ